MKRKLVMTIMAALMMISSLTSVMAGETDISVKSTASKSAECIDAVKIDMQEGDSDSLFISKSLESDENGKITFIGGEVTKESFEKILNALNKSEDEKMNLLKQFDENLEINKKINELYKDTENKSESQLKEIYEQVNKMNEDRHDLFDDEMIDKALEMKIAEKINVEIAASEEDAENNFYTIKSN